MLMVLQTAPPLGPHLHFSVEIDDEFTDPLILF